MFGKTGFFYWLTVLFLLFLLARRIVHSPFGLSLRAIRNNPLRAAAIGIPVNRRLIAIYTLAAFYAGIAGALFTQTTALASLDVFAFERSADLMLVLVIGGTGYLYGGLIGAVVFRCCRNCSPTITPQYWQFWIGLVLVVIVLVGRAAHASLGAVACRTSSSGSSPDARPSLPCRRASAMTHRAGNHRTGKAVRRPERHARPVAQDRAGRPPRADRPERRRQDHGDQPADRRAQAELRAASCSKASDITDLPVHKRVLRGLSRTFQINQLYADLTPLETIGLAVSERLGRGGDWWRRMGTRERRQWRDRRDSWRASICSTS